MYTQVTENDFIQAFIDMDRGEQFSRDGLMSLYNFFEQLEDDTGEPMELDVIAICCDFSELYPDEAAEQYDINLKDDDEIIDWLRDNTIVIPISDYKFIIQDF